MTAKRWGAVLVALGFLASLFGCSDDPSKHGDWTDVSMHRTSSVMTDSYHFSIGRTDGGMTVTGFCYVDEAEYRVEGTYLSAGTEWMLEQADLALRPTYKSRKASANDAARNTETVTHEDGHERTISLTSDERAELIAALAADVRSAAESLMHGEWSFLYLDFSCDNYSEGYHFEVLNEGGILTAKGACSVYDEDNGGYREYVSENGFVLDTATAEAIAALGLERYPAIRTAAPDPDSAEILDGSAGGLTLGFSDGYQQKKATPSSVDDAIAELLKQEFAKKAEPQ